MLVLKTSTMPPSKMPLNESFFTESPPQTMKAAHRVYPPRGGKPRSRAVPRLCKAQWYVGRDKDPEDRHAAVAAHSRISHPSRARRASALPCRGTARDAGPHLRRDRHVGSAARRAHLKTL